VNRLGSPSFLERVPGAFARRMALWFGRRPFLMRSKFPLVSFTFDDFPRSALRPGGSILEQYGGRATYFVAMGLEARTIATGTMFKTDDLDQLLERGHELGCHTFHHHPAWETSTPEYDSSVVRNMVSLARLRQAVRPLTHSYPISYPRPSTKRRLSRKFRACRGGGQSFNKGVIDLNYLSSYFIEQSRGDFSLIERLICENNESAGWLIFSTHDVSEHPSRYGCTPAFFEKVASYSRRSGANILTISAALDTIAAA
jgi:peptidoglycan/xylan/chitin deacetylase (PgdA/CDA1 family)